MRLRPVKQIMIELETYRMLKQLLEEVQSLRNEIRELRAERRITGIKSYYLNMNEACKFLHVGRTTMQNRLKNNELSFAIKDGKKWLFPIDRLKEYAAKTNVS